MTRCAPFIARDLGHEVRASELSWSDLYIADEIFVCGTASEVNMVASVVGGKFRCRTSRAAADPYGSR